MVTLEFCTVRTVDSALCGSPEIPEGRVQTGFRADAGVSIRRSPYDGPGCVGRRLMTDAEAEAPEDGRERKYATLREARSVFAPKSAALRRWRKAKRSAEREGEVMRDRYIAVLEIGREDGLCIEQRGNDGHMLLWGEKNQLAAKVVRVFDGDDEQENQGEE